MSSTAASGKIATSEERAPEREPSVRAAKHWVHQLARTLKSCRVYGSLTNPVVERARLELANELRAVIDEHGALVLRFTSDDVLMENVSLYPARSRDDNLALPFHRDGIQRITFSQGIETAELDVLIDAILQVTGRARMEDDLVTLLWQAQLHHVEIEYVPAEAEVGGGDFEGPGGDGPGSQGSGGRSAGSGGSGFGSGEGGEGEFGDEGPSFGTVEVDAGASGPDSGVEIGVPWPDLLPEVPKKESEPKPAEEATAAETGPGRSDDWQVGSDTDEAEAVFEELDLTSTPGLESFRTQLESERQVAEVTSALQLSQAYLAASETEDDRIEIARFLPRVVRHAAVDGAWREAGVALTLLDECGKQGWSLDDLAEELCHPAVVAAAAAKFESMDSDQVGEFIAFAHRLDDWAVDLLGRVLVAIGGSHHQDGIVAAIADECRTCPERLAPWLSDPRWTVVRTTVRILGKIGGDATAGLLEAVAEHDQQAVRDDVLAALGGVSLARAKTILFAFLDDADTPTFCSIVQRLGQARDAEVADLMLKYVTHPEFERQPIEERRAIYAALGTAGGDEVLPELEAELTMANWFGGGQDAHRQAVALCIAQIGTPLAKQALQRGTRSNRAALRSACQEALARFGRS